jgi:hypothetical protein
MPQAALRLRNASRGRWEGNHGLSGGAPDITLRQFLNNNPDFARRYHENPNIIYDHETMEHEPGFRAYLREHPDVEAQLYGGRPGYNREGRWEGNRGEALNSKFLNEHPNLAKQLRDNPSLVNDPEFVRTHPNLREYLRNNPEAR